jgi:8-oxo-dGTP pyrophosphatase MutT (NUDIX family)
MERPKNQATLCIPLNGDEVLLGMKKRGFGAGKYNSFGGKFDSSKDKTIEDTAVRELEEESGLCSKLEDLTKVAEMDYFYPYKTEWNQTVHIYTISTFSGEPQETEEMAFQWFHRNNIPYHQMWDDDKYWLPLVLEGKCLRGTVISKEEKGEHLVDYKEIRLI